MHVFGFPRCSFLSGNYLIHPGALPNHLNIVESCGLKVLFDLIKCIAVSALSDCEHIYGEDGPIKWRGSGSCPENGPSKELFPPKINTHKSS